MKRHDWLLCERAPHWAAALRLALNRYPRCASSSNATSRLYETRNLQDMLTRLSAKSRSFVLIEVRRSNLADVLACLAEIAPHFPGTASPPFWTPHSILSTMTMTIRPTTGQLKKCWPRFPKLVLTHLPTRPATCTPSLPSPTATQKRSPNNQAQPTASRSPPGPWRGCLGRTPDNRYRRRGPGINFPQAIPAAVLI